MSFRCSVSSCSTLRSASEPHTKSQTLSKNTKLKRRTPVAKLEVTDPNSTLSYAVMVEC